MIVSVHSLERLLFEVSAGIKAEEVKDIVEAELGCTVEQVTQMDRHRRQMIIGGQLMPAYDLKEGPWWNQGNALYLVTYRKDVSKQFRDTIKKMEKAARAKEQERADRETAKKEANRQAKIAALKAELDILGPKVEEPTDATN